MQKKEANCGIYCWEKRKKKKRKYNNFEILFSPSRNLNRKIIFKKKDRKKYKKSCSQLLIFEKIWFDFCVFFFFLIVAFFFPPLYQVERFVLNTKETRTKGFLYYGLWGQSPPPPPLSTLSPASVLFATNACDLSPKTRQLWVDGG